MPNDIAAAETREMRLVSAALRDKGPLSAYIATRRSPGKRWMTWEQIAYDLFADTGETVTRAGLTNWARRYGIPTDTRAASDRAEYVATLTECGIELGDDEAA